MVGRKPTSRVRLRGVTPHTRNPSGPDRIATGPSGGSAPLGAARIAGQGFGPTDGLLCHPT